jgi:hypothetical protein
MGNFIYQQGLPLLGVFLVGAFGWWVANWIARPITDFEELRRLTREELNVWKHLARDSIQRDKDQGADALRRLSAQVEAVAASAALPSLYFKYYGYDLAKAHKNLSGLANVEAMTGDERKIRTNEVELALKLPVSETPDRIKLINARIEKSG